MALKCDFPKCGTAATSSQNRSRPLCPLHPPVHRMPGPAQLEVCRLKVVKANEAEVRQALRRQGYTRTRVSQLWAECQQSPPRSWAQRQCPSPLGFVLVCAQPGICAPFRCGLLSFCSALRRERSRTPTRSPQVFLGLLTFCVQRNILASFRCGLLS